MRPLVVSLFLGGFAIAPLVCADKKLEHFEREVRPLLAEKCQGCHGPKMAFAGLRLDTRAGAAQAREKLLDALAGRNGLKQMPPTGKLPEGELAKLERWVADGMPWPEEVAAPGGFDLESRRREHWAWQPVRAVPSQAFKLNHHATVEAERNVLLRRATFDLTGLPPTPEEIADFERDGDHEKLIDRLLASPRFGERMARRWMDLIRFSESHGSEGDPDVPEAWRYRDYLIRAFNADVPYDQLLREHIAGDLLPAPRINRALKLNESLLGMAHWRMVEHGFQPVDPWEDRVKWTDNQVDVFSKAFQGLTVSCARCHDHKFDAISQRDYYALFGILAGMRPTQVAVDSSDVLLHNRDRLAELKPGIRAALARRWRTEAGAVLERLPGSVKQDAPWYPLVETGTDIAAWMAEQRKAATEARAFNAANVTQRWDVAADYAKWPRQGVGAPDGASAPGEFAVAVEGPAAITGIYPAGVYSHLLSTRHGAAITSPRFRIETDSISLRMLGGNFSFAQLIIENYAVPRGGIYHLRTSGKRDEMGWVRWDTTFWKGFTAYIEFATFQEATHSIPDDQDNREKRRIPKPHPGRSWWGAAEVAFHNSAQAPKAVDTAVEYALEDAPADRAEYREHLRKRLTEAIGAWETGRLSNAQSVFLDAFLRAGLLSNQAEHIAAVSEYRRLENEISAPRRAPGLIEEAGPPQPLLIRGDHRKPGDPVDRRYLTALDSKPYPDARTMRLELAREIANAKNPLTARVLANRLWQWTFRTGLVSTPDNFGKLGAAPSDPDMLDWLASRFVEEGWSIKKTLRMLMTSKAYRSAELPMRRLEAEEIRDAILAATGKLDGTTFGPSVPVYYAHETGATKGDRPKGPLDGNGRRSLYLEVRRNATNPFLEVFDVYKPASTRGLRDVTNVPGQSLALLNSPFVIGQADGWNAPVEEMYLRVLGRRPSPEERDAAETFAAANGKGPLAHALFNLKEFLYVR